MQLALSEQKPYAPTTINLRLAAVRRVAYEAADSGLLSPELAAGIRRVKGVRRIGVRLGNWLTADQGRWLLLNSHGDGLRSKRNYAILALLIGCGLRRGELLALSAASIQVREDHWVIVDLHGKAGHIRTVRSRNSQLLHTIQIPQNPTAKGLFRFSTACDCFTFHAPPTSLCVTPAKFGEDQLRPRT